MTYQESVENFRQALREFVAVVLDELIDLLERLAWRFR